MNFDYLQPTQESVARAASVCMQSFTPEQLKEQWNSAFLRADATHRLTLLYLANEIIQRTRKTHGNTYIKNCFGPLLAPAFSALVRDRSDYLDKLSRIVNVWEERGVVDKEDLIGIRKALGSEQTSISASPPPSQATSTSTKRVRIVENEEDDNKKSPNNEEIKEISTSSADADGLLSLDPVLATLARANSNITITSIDEKKESSFLMDIVRLAKDLDPPSQYENLIDDINQGLSESIMDELENEKIDRISLRIYKILKTKQKENSTLENDELLAVTSKLAETSQAKTLDKSEAEISERAKQESETFEEVETVENVSIDLRESMLAVQERKRKLEKQLERDENVLVQLSELLEAFSAPVTQVRDEVEYEQLNDAIDNIDTLLEKLKNEGENLQKLATRPARQPRWGAPAPSPIMPPPLPTAWVPLPPPPTLPPTGAYLPDQKQQQQPQQRWGAPVQTWQNPPPAAWMPPPPQQGYHPHQQQHQQLQQQHQQGRYQ